MSDQAPDKDQKEAPKTGGWYAHYVLFVLVIVYVFNFIDRNILSILSQEIQKEHSGRTSLPSLVLPFGLCLASDLTWLPPLSIELTGFYGGKRAKEAD